MIPSVWEMLFKGQGTSVSMNDRSQCVNNVVLCNVPIVITGSAVRAACQYIDAITNNPPGLVLLPDSVLVGHLNHLDQCSGKFVNSNSSGLATRRGISA